MSPYILSSNVIFYNPTLNENKISRPFTFVTENEILKPFNFVTENEILKPFTFVTENEIRPFIFVLLKMKY